jgi:four helix bundle protein
MNIAQASLEECRYYCLLSKDLKYMDMKGHLEQLEEVSKLLDAYAKSIRSSDS